MLNYNVFKMLFLVFSLLFFQWSAAEHHHFDEDSHEHSVECQLCVYLQYVAAIPNPILKAEFVALLGLKPEYVLLNFQPPKYVTDALPRAPPSSL